MKIAVIGLGQIGKIYIAALLRLGFSLNDMIGIDIRNDRITDAMLKWPGLKCWTSVKIADLGGVDAVIVATNTPSHHKVILNLLAKRIENIFCEKPLGLNTQAVEKIENSLEFHGDIKIYTAFLINFSEVVLSLRKFMIKKDFCVVEAYVNWGKDRTGNNRPTPGDLEDEACHGAGVVHSLAKINQKVKGIKVFGKISHLSFVDEKIQKEACELDESFPKIPNSSSFITEVISTNKADVIVGIHSSFVNIRQERTVHVTLGDAKTGKPKWLALMEFDTPDGDVLTLREVGPKKETRREVFGGDKVLAETRAFVNAISGEDVDFRLTDVETAKLAVKFSDAVAKSSKTGEIVKI